ncbi:MAG: outer membrane lipoprotein-sorting protein, partial [Verrucomicrobiota bacterium]
MHRILLIATSLLFAIAAPVAVQAQDNQTPFGKPIDKLTPDEILSLVRYSYTLHDRDFNAQLRKDFKAIKFKLSLKPNYIRFRFDDPPQAIHLDTTAERLALREIVQGSNDEIPEARYSQTIRGTDIAYEDLALRFLYWPNPRVVGNETFKTRAAWKVQIVNPDTRGPYGYVLVWIDKASGGMLKMEGYSRGAKPE